MNTPEYIIAHCSDVSQDDLKNQFVSINNYHRDVRLFPVSSLGIYVGYHRLITGGKNYKCREDFEVGAHCNNVVNNVSMNFKSLGVCIGFDGDIEMPTTEHVKLLQQQIWEWQDKYKIPNERVKFHRDYATNKTCPGRLITREWLDEILKRPAPKKPLEQEIKQLSIKESDELNSYRIFFDLLKKFLGLSTGLK